MGKNLLISFSGGRTSAFMTKLIVEHPKTKDMNILIVFANTGKEYEETLRFVNECDKRWNLNMVWVEAVIHPNKGEGTTHRIVDFETADRSGATFEAYIAKYGIPSLSYPDCTRELKAAAISSYVRSLGIEDWVTAIGMRADEPKRLKEYVQRVKNPVYPLAGWLVDNVDNRFIRKWWANQPFDLQLPDYKGNCDLCWKKSLRKRLTIVKEEPERAEWWGLMERKYGTLDRSHFDRREDRTISDLIEESKRPFTKAVDYLELENSKPRLIDIDPEMDIEFDCFCEAT